MNASRRVLCALFFGPLMAAPVMAESPDVLTVYRSASCGCCGDWIAYLRQEGFEVREQIREQLAQLKREVGVPSTGASCHTAVVNGRFIEGHVPAREIRWLLQAGAEIRGVTVPGMPLGAPGMEIDGYDAQPYSVLAVTQDGDQPVLVQYQ